MKSKKNKAAMELGRLGGIKRAEKTKAQLRQIALKGWQVRRRGEEIEDAKKKLASVEC